MTLENNGSAQQSGGDSICNRTCHVVGHNVRYDATFNVRYEPGMDRENGACGNGEIVNTMFCCTIDNSLQNAVAIAEMVMKRQG